MVAMVFRGRPPRPEAVSATFIADAKNLFLRKRSVLLVGRGAGLATLMRPAIGSRIGPVLETPLPPDTCREGVRL
jgi:hypothetical protein